MNRRDILFRGKRADNGEWVYGSYVKGESGRHYIFRGNDNSQIYDPDEVNTVDPPTVGQFTGLTDKNGAPIFEGDILGDWNDIATAMMQERGRRMKG